MTIRAANLAPSCVDVILDDDLQPERAVIEGGAISRTNSTAGDRIVEPV